MPRTKKPAGTAVDRRNGRRAANLSVVSGGRFDPPEGLSEPAAKLWEAYWDDAVSSVQTPVDQGVLIRWITEYDRYLRTVSEADEQPLVQGSMGQSVENPLYKIAYRALDAAERCERQMGVGPLYRSNLGIAVIAEQKSLAEMNARYGGDGGDPDPVEAADPRVIDA
ncbi:MAG TPA: P27 family phage terminase small subunit [Jiangellaceae bacterium]|nr:P27 family phage terminase small subunit [Jiangellaceae bacterium]